MFKESITVLAIVAGLVATSAQARDGDNDRKGAQHEARFSQMDTNGDGQVTAEEINAQATARFVAADVDGNGALSMEEMQVAAQSMQTQRLLKRFDANGDGALSAEELAMPESGKGAKRFERMDADNSGDVSLEEMQARRDPAKMIARLDADKDGAVSLEEFATTRGHDKKHGHDKN